jgi:hypothetical protein
MKFGEANPGHLYGCWGTDRGGTKTVYLPAKTFLYFDVQRKIVIRAQIVEPVTTDWLDITCGSIGREKDQACKGCVNLNEGKND